MAPFSVSPTMYMHIFSWHIYTMYMITCHRSSKSHCNKILFQSPVRCSNNSKAASTEIDKHPCSGTYLPQRAYLYMHTCNLRTAFMWDEAAETHVHVCGDNSSERGGILRCCQISRKYGIWYETGEANCYCISWICGILCSRMLVYICNITYTCTWGWLLFPQNVTADKQPPAWLTPENLTQLNHIKDFIEKLLVNSEEKRRLAAGERERKKVIGKGEGGAEE